MTEQERKVIAASLWATRASVDVALIALGELSDEAESDTGCAHPVEMRQDLTTMGGPEGWRCRSCGFSTLQAEPPTDPQTEPPSQAEQES